MSKAEEFAIKCDRASGHMSKLIRITGIGDGENWLSDMADEFRRLAQVERELLAFKDSLGEPVAWMNEDGEYERTYAPWMEQEINPRWFPLYAIKEVK